MDVDSDAVRLSLDARFSANHCCDDEYCFRGCSYCIANDLCLILLHLVFFLCSTS